NVTRCPLRVTRSPLDRTSRRSLSGRAAIHPETWPAPAVARRCQPLLSCQRAMSPPDVDGLPAAVCGHRAEHAPLLEPWCGATTARAVAAAASAARAATNEKAWRRNRFISYEWLPG